MARGESADEIAKRIATRRWRDSPKSERDTAIMLRLIESFFDRDDDFTYLEFGTCFGTTLSSVLRHFRNTRGIGLEVDPARFAVTRWLQEKVGEELATQGRIELHCTNVLCAPFAPASIDVVFMDTNHRYPDDYAYITYLLEGGFLRDGFLFIGDDPMHTGTSRARESFIRARSSEFRIITREDWNLWWFYRLRGRS